MNRTTAVALLLIGILLILGSCAPAGYVIYHEAAIDPADSISLSGGASSNNATFHAQPGSLARFTLQARVTTHSVQEDPDSIDHKYIARFKFPVSYTISDSGGNVLMHEDVTLAWKEGRSISKSHEETASTGGTLTAATTLKKFTVPADGNINIKIAIRPDTTYGASYASPKLSFYEGMIDNTWYVIGCLVMLLAGVVMALIGFIFVLTITTREGARTQNQIGAVTAAGDAHNREVNQNAMIIQLSALAGYFVPFGNVILPLILWQIWREQDPYVDRMGCEAVNFQLSMLIYYFICFILLFILIGFLLIFALILFHLTFIIIGAVQTSKGVEYRYPMIIRFIKVQDTGKRARG